MSRRAVVRMASLGASVAVVVLALIGATVSGAAGVAGKRAAYEKNPSTYGVCGGYNS